MTFFVAGRTARVERMAMAEPVDEGDVSFNKTDVALQFCVAVALHTWGKQ